MRHADGSKDNRRNAQVRDEFGTERSQKSQGCAGDEAEDGSCPVKSVDDGLTLPRGFLPE
jgi:hypothetical protein